MPSRDLSHTPTPGTDLDLIVINPGAAHGIAGDHPIYGNLGAELTALEPPLWCRLIAGYVRDRGFKVKIIDQEAMGFTAEKVATIVGELRPRLVCLAVYGHQPSASTQQMVGASALALAIKKVGPFPIIMVGGHVSALPERTLTEEWINYAAVGEGPVTIVGLLNAPGRPLTHAEALNIPGLVWKRNTGRHVFVNDPAPLLDVKELHGNVWDLLPMGRYRAHNWQVFGNLSARQPYASIYTSLGCPWKCEFCCINAPFGTNRYRMRDPMEVVADVAFLTDRYGVYTFKFVDEMFVLNERHYTEIAKGLKLINGDDKLNIWAYSRIDTVNPEHLPLLRAGGIRWLALGIESANPDVRDGAAKRMRNDDIVGVVRSIQAAGINVIGNYIFGLPDDDYITMGQTFRLACDLNTEFANFYSAMAYPGSALYAQAIKKGWTLPETWRGYSQHNDDCRPLDTKHLTGADVLRFRDDAFNAYFARPAYRSMIAEKFGIETVAHIDQMLRYKLKRKLLAPDPEPMLPQEAML